MTSRFAFLSAIASLCLTAAAHAGPAVATGTPYSQIDPNTFIVGHPASPTWRAGHANHEHPAVTQARAAKVAGIDPNTFTVQPPASVQWLVRGEEIPAQVAAVTR